MLECLLTNICWVLEPCDAIVMHATFQRRRRTATSLHSCCQGIRMPFQQLSFAKMHVLWATTTQMTETVLFLFAVQAK